MDKKYWLGYSFFLQQSYKFYKLLTHFKNPKQIWRASTSELKKTGLNQKLIQLLLKTKESIDLEKEWTGLNKQDISLISIFDNNYPPSLKQIADPPPVLYAKGNLRIIGDSLAIVGCRKASNEALSFAKKTASELSRAGVTIISGLARGTDTAAHKGAIAGEGRTIAILGCGLDICYPPENKTLFKQIEENGLLLSEFPPGSPPFPKNFPQRNRLISGLAKTVLIVQAPAKSGTLITAHYALEQGKDILVVPGAFDDSSWFGSNQLIKDGAFLVSSIEEVAEYLAIKLNPSNIKLTSAEEEILRLIKAKKPTLDELCLDTKKKISEISQLLTALEIKGFVTKDLSTRYFIA